MPRIRRKLPRNFASLLVALSIACVPALLVRVARAAGQAPPAPAQKSALDTPARELARRIAASLPGGTRVEIEVRNQSSLSEDDAAAIRAALAGELSAHGLRTHDEGPGAASIIVTLSENVQGYVWVAQIQHGDDSAVLLQSVPRGAIVAPAPVSERVILRKRLLWSGTPWVLDARETPTRGPLTDEIYLLEIEDGVLVVTDSSNSQRVQLPVAAFDTRDPKAVFAPGEDIIAVDVWTSPTRFQECSLGVGDHPEPHCEVQVRPYTWDLSAALPFYRGHWIRVHLSCANGELIGLAGSDGDYTQPDAVAAYPGVDGPAVSSPLAFSGPVMQLRGNNADGALVVVKNLTSRSYEVYRITASCGE